MQNECTPQKNLTVHTSTSIQGCCSETKDGTEMEYEVNLTGGIQVCLPKVSRAFVILDWADHAAEISASPTKHAG